MKKTLLALILVFAFIFASCNVLEQDVSNEPPAADADTSIVDEDMPNRIQLHRVNDYDRSDREYSGDGLSPTAYASAGEILLFWSYWDDNAMSYLGESILTWYDKALFQWNEEEGTFVVTKTEELGETGYENWVINKDSFIIASCPHYAEAVGLGEQAKAIAGLEKGDKVYIYGDCKVLIDGKGTIDDTCFSIGTPAGDGYIVAGDIREQFGESEPETSKLEVSKPETSKPETSIPEIKGQVEFLDIPFEVNVIIVPVLDPVYAAGQWPWDGGIILSPEELPIGEHVKEFWEPDKGDPSYNEWIKRYTDEWFEDNWLIVLHGVEKEINLKHIGFHFEDEKQPKMLFIYDEGDPNFDWDLTYGSRAFIEIAKKDIPYDIGERYTVKFEDGEITGNTFFFRALETKVAVSNGYDLPEQDG